MATPPAGDVRAARRYGRLVDDIAAGYTNPLTGRKLTGAALLIKLASGESGFRANADSGKAHGKTQFTPGSRQVAISKFGVDPWRSTDEAYHAAALHLLGKINGSKGLEGYNPGSSSYPSYILNQRVGSVGGSSSSRGPSGGGSPGAPAGSAPDGGGGSTDVPQGADVSAAVAALLSQAQARSRPVSAPAAPAHSAQVALPQGFVAPSSGGPAVAQGPDVSALLDAVRTQGGNLPSAGGSDAGEPRIQAPGGSSGGSSAGKGSGAHEIIYRGPGGATTVDNGRFVPADTFSGHEDHVHLAAGPRTTRRLADIAAKQFGLTVREFEPYDKVDPVHTKGSYHYSGRAFDASGDPRKMAAFAKYAARLLGAR